MRAITLFTIFVISLLLISGCNSVASQEKKMIERADAYKTEGCSEQKEVQQRDGCYLYQAMEEKNSTICANITNEKMKADCNFAFS